MTRYRVEKSPGPPEIVDADHVAITGESGVLVLAGPDDRVMRAFAPGHWASVERLPVPSDDPPDPYTQATKDAVSG